MTHAALVDSPGSSPGAATGSALAGVVQRGSALPLSALVDAVAAALAATLLAWSQAASVAPATLGMAAGWPLLLSVSGGYRPSWQRRERRAAVTRAGTALGGLAWLSASMPTPLLAPLDALLTTMVVVTSSLVVRSVPPGLVKRVSGRTPRTRTRVLLAGPSAGLTEVASVLTPDHAHVEIVASWQPSPGEHRGDTAEQLAARAAAAAVDVVLVLPCAELDDRALRHLGWLLERSPAELFVATAVRGVAPRRTAAADVGGLPTLRVGPSVAHARLRCLVTQAGRAAALLLLVLLVPVMAAVAAAVRLDSRGPVFFRQERVGQHGRPFTLFKFRSMKDGAEQALAALQPRNESDGPLFKLRADPRVTGIGSFLRRYSLDELPQLVNVVRGEMALVGPRPALPREVDTYDTDARRRLAVKPGLTGLWQVSGRSDLSWHDGLRLDVHYVDNWSLRLELSILLRTAGAVLAGRGAY